MDKTICFTGRRPKFLCGYSGHDPYKPFVNELKEILRTYYMMGYKRFISGGAQGFDQLAFWAVENLKREHADIENIVYIPFMGYGGHWVSDGIFGQNEFKLMCQRADKVHFCLNEYLNNDRGRVNFALTKRNHDMVDNADLVIALYPEDNFQLQRGGTAECMKYAVINQHKPLLHLSYENKAGYLSITGMKYYGSEIWEPKVKTYTFNEIAREMFAIRDEYVAKIGAANAALIDSKLFQNINLDSEATYSEEQFRETIKTVRQNCESAI